ncbi:uncharacterized protein Z520_04796 [Fonsecaea multimorphosa CBS 102226]|uniref:Fe2OG dioxygenase domain-containing protein n=1 Tax=Fonsecaea multimorphosa CBS 102226 TaxID=1442371 RepID=A0A0D2HBE2_9EURO|nr:uncharacterized protein Z520_04796 [Fonsecaea multimorphosa CBS 102226]KIX99220.1 hypothetical protein Z520_04796 [Fonsecaea multimorphosa CBS 102226]OAL25917.1 hypothetical protein AYO22_04544 [Fonsecaea multimorphosa]
MAISYEVKPTFIIPTVDLTAYFKNPESPEAEQIVEQIRTACATSGFFQITGHGVSQSLQERVFTAAKKLFALPEDVKRTLVGPPGRGYEVLGSQILEEGKKPDLKEGYFIGREVPDNKPPFRPFQEANIWPDMSLISDSEFKEPLLEYHDTLSKLSFHVTHILFRGLSGFDTSIFTDFCKDPLASIRLLHYPPHPPLADANLVGAGAHTDFGALTLLLQDGHSGLQVLKKTPEQDQWIDVPPQPNAYVVNVGDFLESWTGGAYKSNVHRVINTSGTDRYSIPFFWDGNADCVIKPLDGSLAKGYTVEEHMLSRYAQSYA